jgi:hypothetical protein
LSTPFAIPHELPLEVWDHILSMVNDERDLASASSVSRMLYNASSRSTQRMFQMRWATACARMCAAVDAWEGETAIEWRQRYDVQICQSEAHNDDEHDHVRSRHPARWMCDRGLPDQPKVRMACDDCVSRANHEQRIGDAPQRRWARRRIDVVEPHVGTFDWRLYAVCHWMSSRRLDQDVDFVVPERLKRWADPEAASALADRWSRPARYGALADSPARPLHGMLALVGLAMSEMGSIRGWMPIAWRRVRIGLGCRSSSRELWGAQFVLVCCDRTSPLWGAGVLLEQNSTLAMGRWVHVTDDLAALIGRWQRHERGSKQQEAGGRINVVASKQPCNINLGRTLDVDPVIDPSLGDDPFVWRRPSRSARRDFVAWLWETHAANVTRAQNRDASGYQYGLPKGHNGSNDDDRGDIVTPTDLVERLSRVATLRAADDDAPIETASDDDDGAFWHCPPRATRHDHDRVVHRSRNRGRVGLFW